MSDEQPGQRRFHFTAGTDAGDDEDLEPIVVELEGHPPLSAVDWEEEFRVVPIAPAGVIDDLVSSIVVDSKGRRRYSTPSLMAFMRGVVVPEDRDRFEDLTRDQDRVLPVETLGEIVVALADAVVGRPTGPSSNSGNGRRGKNRTSGRTSPKKAGTPKP